MSNHAPNAAKSDQNPPSLYSNIFISISFLSYSTLLIELIKKTLHLRNLSLCLKIEIYSYHINIPKWWIGHFLLLSYVIAKDSDARRQYLTVKSLSTESAKSSASSRGSDTSPGHKSFGGSYSTRGGGKKMDWL